MRRDAHPTTTRCWLLTERTVDDSLLSDVCTGTTVMSWGSIRGTAMRVSSLSAILRDLQSVLTKKSVHIMESPLHSYVTVAEG